MHTQVRRLTTRKASIKSTEDLKTMQLQQRSFVCCSSLFPPFSFAGTFTRHFVPEFDTIIFPRCNHVSRSPRHGALNCCNANRLQFANRLLLVKLEKFRTVGRTKPDLLSARTCQNEEIRWPEKNACNEFFVYTFTHTE